MKLLCCIGSRKTLQQSCVKKQVLQFSDGTSEHTTDISCSDLCSFEVQTMSTPPSYATKSPRQNEYTYETVSECGDLDYPERIIIPSEEFHCSTAEDPGVTKSVIEAGSSDYWSELVERMDCKFIEH